MYKLIEVRKINEGRITIININRPTKMNSVNKSTAAELIQAFTEFE